MTNIAEIPGLKFSLTWGENAGAGYIRTPPQASQIGVQNGAASFNDGFVPLNFTPVATGGVPPFGQDMNGVLSVITQWLQWQQMGGPIFYDAAFSASIGGYPNGAVLRSTANYELSWLSTTDNNTSNPDTGGANWLQIPEGVPHTWTAYNTFTQSVTGNQGFISSAFDAGGAQFRAMYGNYGAFLRNDGGSAYLMQTGNGTPTGSFNSYRPFYWAFANGAVTIDGTGSGVTMGGGLSVSGTITEGGLPVSTQAYAAAQAATAQANAETYANGTNVFAVPGYAKMPGGLIVQFLTGSLSASASGSFYYYTTFPNGCLGGSVTPNNNAFIFASPFNAAYVGIQNTSSSIGANFTIVVFGW